MGYATYNETTGKFIEQNPDIDCRGGVPLDQSFCNAASWKYSTWLNGNVPGLELQNLPRKDTVIHVVPSGGNSRQTIQDCGLYMAVLNFMPLMECLCLLTSPFLISLKPLVISKRKLGDIYTQDSEEEKQEGN